MKKVIRKDVVWGPSSQIWLLNLGTKAVPFCPASCLLQMYTVLSMMASWEKLLGRLLNRKNMFCLKNERYGSQPGWKQGFGSEHVTSWNMKSHWSRIVKCIHHLLETTWSLCITVRSRSGDGIVGNPQAWPGLQPLHASLLQWLISMIIDEHL